MQAPMSKLIQSFPVTLGMKSQRRQMLMVMSSVIQLFLVELLLCLYKHNLEITGLHFRQSACVSFLCATERVSVSSWGSPYELSCTWMPEGICLPSGLSSGKQNVLGLPAIPRPLCNHLELSSFPGFEAWALPHPQAKLAKILNHTFSGNPLKEKR